MEHYIWSTLPNVDEISGGSLKVAHFTNKATVNGIVEEAGFDWFTFVEPPFYYQNFLTPMYPRDPGADATPTWRQPMLAASTSATSPSWAASWPAPLPTVTRRGIGEILSLAGDLVSWDDLVGTLNSQGHRLAYEQVTDDPFGMRDMFAYFEQFTYLGPNADEKIVRAAAVSTKPFTDFATWANINMPAPE